jgi:hypothetical protein
MCCFFNGFFDLWVAVVGNFNQLYLDEDVF